jgi:hypothetical protein
MDIRVGDDGVAMGGRISGDELPDLLYETWLDVDFRLAGAADDGGYQATSPERACLFARRANVKSRSERRFR